MKKQNHKLKQVQHQLGKEVFYTLWLPILIWTIVDIIFIFYFLVQESMVNNHISSYSSVCDSNSAIFRESCKLIPDPFFIRWSISFFSMFVIWYFLYHLIFFLLRLCKQYMNFNRKFFVIGIVLGMILSYPLMSNFVEYELNEYNISW